MQFPEFFCFSLYCLVDAFLLDELAEVLKFLVGDAGVDNVDYVADELSVIVCKVLKPFLLIFYLYHSFFSFRLFNYPIRNYANSVPACHFGRTILSEK